MQRGMTNPGNDAAADEAAADAAALLRQQAEELIRAAESRTADTPAALSPAEAQRFLHELRVHQIELEMQNEHLREAQVELNNARARYFDLYDLAPVGYVTISKEGLILEANLTVTTLLGRTRRTLLQRPFSENIIPIPQDQSCYYLYHKQLFATGDQQTCELRMSKKDGTIFWAQLVAAIAQDAAGVAVCRITLSDITEHKLQESAYALMAQLIVRINTPGDFHACLAELTKSLQDWSGCEAVGIRLRDGDDYPYYETRGFPPAFVTLENHLCAQDLHGELVRDSNGQPVLECMCGNVLCGRFDPSKPFFTTHGSFWTNSTTALLASTTAADRQSHTRNRCNSEGYESVALIPLRAAGQVFGLLQFNDRRMNRFNPAMIAQFEKMADSLATAMAQRQAAMALASSQAELQAIYDNAPVMMCLVDADRRVRYANAALTAFMGGAAGEHDGGYACGVFGCINALDDPRGCGFGPNCQGCTLRLAMEDTFKTATGHQNVEFATTLVHDGQPRNVVLLGSTVLIHTKGRDHLLLCLHDITERRRTEAVKTFLAQTTSGPGDESFFNALARYLAQSLPVDFVCIDRLEGDGLMARTLAVWCDGHFEDNVTYALKDTPCGDVVGKTICCFPASVCQFFPRDQVLQELRAESYAGVTLWGHDGQPVGLIAVISRRQMADRALTETTLKLVAGRAAAELERLAAEAEKDLLEAQLQQAQKMESVGRLAGGVAHDFNNMLGVILGHAELALAAVGPTQPIHADLEAIRQTAQRSAGLTRQLLAFARKQTITPKVLDLNATMGGMLKMLTRLIGEDIELAWLPGADLWPVKMDASQLDQIMANLCVNSRDAIAGTGKITVATANHTFTEQSCGAHAGVVPGDYVRITVSDSGCGMDTEALGHVFEPFFTTKAVGAGTGLGLATVYGAVKQNSGVIDVVSAPGQGTIFTIYLPRHQGQVLSVPPSVPAGSAVRGHETILLVEDEPTILKLAARMLGTFGYTVLAAGTPGEAVRLAQEHAGNIDLLMTDVVMPEMNGRDLAKNLLALYPELKRLFMSGYTADIIAHHGVVEQGVCFIQKPFTMLELSAKVRETLDAEKS